MAEKTTVPPKADKRHQPVRPVWLDEVEQQVARFWGATRPFAPGPFRRLAESSFAWAPNVDIFDKDGSLVVKVDLPGVRKEDISVALEGDDLVIRGEREAEAAVKEEDYHRMERACGTFYRRLPLPFAARAEKIAASHADGVLEIHIPAPAEARPGRKEIKVA
jgi:HSP20 family protein